MIKEEEGSEVVENNIIKLNSYLEDSITITALNDDTSTYMGVKSVAEDQSTIINDSKIENKKKSKIAKKKKKQKKKENSFSSDSESKSSQSSSPKEKENQKEKDRNSSTDLLEKEKNKEKEKYEEQNDVNQEEKNKINNENLNEKKALEEIETKFEWEGSGKIVYVTGSFCDWKKFYIMTKNTKGIFSLTLSLPRGFHQYKFKVDNDWTYSKIHPQYEDNGIINNYIDTTNYSNSNENGNEIEIDLENNKNIKNNDKKEEEESNENNKKKKENNKSKEKRKIRKHKKVSSTVLSVNFLNSQNYYTIYYPLRSEFNKKPVPLPGLYKTCFILNEDIKNKEEKKFSEVEYVNNSSSDSSSMNSSKMSLQSVQSKVKFLGEVIPYVEFQNLYHIHSNHLHSKLFYNYVNTIIDSMTTRYRYKFSTFIYYKPNEPVIPLKRIKHSKSFKIKTKK